MKRVLPLSSSGAVSTVTPPPAKKRSLTSQVDVSLVDDSNSSLSPSQAEHKQFVFKDESFEHSGVKGGRKRMWKTLKQILSSERSLQWGENDVTYANLEAPPSFQPAKKYSDISGMEAPYTDPQTKLRFATATEFRTVRQLPYDIIHGYLSLRNASIQS